MIEVLKESARWIMEHPRQAVARGGLATLAVFTATGCDRPIPVPPTLEHVIDTLTPEQKTEAQRDRAAARAIQRGLNKHGYHYGVTEVAAQFVVDPEFRAEEGVVSLYEPIRIDEDTLAYFSDIDQETCHVVTDTVEIAHGEFSEGYGPTERTGPYIPREFEADIAIVDFRTGDPADMHAAAGPGGCLVVDHDGGFVGQADPYIAIQPISVPVSH